MTAGMIKQIRSRAASTKSTGDHKVEWRGGSLDHGTRDVPCRLPYNRRPPAASQQVA